MGLLDLFKKRNDGSDVAAEVKRTTDRMLRQFIDGLHEAFIQINTNSVVTVWNTQAEEIFGWSRTEAEGKLLHELIIPEGYRDMHEDGIKRYLETRKSNLLKRTIEVPALTKDGRTIPISMYVDPVEEDGQIVHFNSYIQDRSQLKKAELDRERYEAIISTMQDALYSVGRDKIILTWNPGAEKVFGWTAREAIGNPVSLIVPPGYKDDVDNFLQMTLDGDVLGPFTTKRITKDGRLIDVNIVVSPLKDITSFIIGASLLARDVTEERQNEKVRAIFEALLNSAPAAVFAFDRDGRVIAVNKFALELYRINSASDVEGHTFDEFVTEEDRQIIQRVFDRVLEEQKPVENLYIHRNRPDGTSFEALATYSPIMDEKGEAIGVYTASTTLEQFKVAVEKIGLDYETTLKGIMKTQATLLD